MFPFASLHADTQVLVAQYMAFDTMMQFRSTTRSHHKLIDDVLAQSFRDILRVYVTDVDYMADMLRILNVFISGSAALNFFLREPTDTSAPLSLLAPAFMFDSILSHLIDKQGARLLSSTRPTTVEQGINSYARLSSRGRIIIVCQSSSVDPLRPICMPTHTATAVYVNPSYFGIIWPSLTLNRLSLLGPYSRPATTLDDGTCARAVDIKLWAWMWSHLNIRRQHCARELYICPAQPRRALDPGTLHGKMLAAKNVSLTSRPVFRLDNRPCRGICLADNFHLRNKYTFITI